MNERETETGSSEPPSTVKIYECDQCGHRVRAEHQPEICPNCGGDLFDISVPRE